MVVFGNLAILHESKICGRHVRGDEGGAMLLKLTFKVVVIVTLFWLESLLCVYIYIGFTVLLTKEKFKVGKRFGLLDSEIDLLPGDS